MLVSSNSSREFDRNDRESASRRHQYGNSPLDPSRRGGPSVAARGGPNADRQLYTLDADAADSDGYRDDDRDDEEAGDEHETSFTNLLQDAVSSTSPRSAQLQQRSQGRPASLLPIASNGNLHSSRDNGANIVRMTIRVTKEGNKLGFGIRHDSQRKLRVSTLQGNSAAAKSPLRLGDILLSVNGITLNDLGFLEVIQHLKATKPGELVFDIERDVNASPGRSYDYPDMDIGDEYLGESSSYPQAPTPGTGRVAKIASSGPPSRQASPQLGNTSSAVVDHGGMNPSRTAAFGASSMDAASMASAGMAESQRKRARPYVLPSLLSVCLIVNMHLTLLVLPLSSVRQARLLTPT